MKIKAVYLSGLNGIRAIAAVAVLVSHITLSLENFGLNPYIFGSMDDGNPQGLSLAGFGVSIFFTLSGFMITYLLLIEKKRGFINVNKFYKRRILRIWPLYYLFLLICLICYHVFNLNYLANSFYYYIFFGANVAFVTGDTLPFLAHYWSLGVEEQFYIFFPWIAKLSNRLFLNFMIFGSFILISLKIFLHFYFPGSLLELFLHVTRFHCMLIGGIGGLLYYQERRIFIQIVNSFYIQVTAWLIILAVALNQFHLASVIDNELISLVAVILIVGQVSGQSPINLENRIMDYLGKISYGIYVIHPLIIFGYSRLGIELEFHTHLQYIIIYASVILTTFLLAHLSYRYFELYFLKLKAKQSVVLSKSARYN